MHATSPYEVESRSSSRCVSGGTRASSGRSTIGARTPSTSRKSAARAGSAASAASRSTQRSVADSAEIGNTSGVMAEDVWIPLVDEPIGSIVEQLQSENPEIDALVSSPGRI